MKLNKQILKQIIKEELENLKENMVDALKMAADTDVNRPDKTSLSSRISTSDVRRGAADAAKQQVASGITDEERGLIRDLVAQLSASAGKTNILSGVLGTKIQQLIAVLNKVTGDQDGGKE